MPGLDRFASAFVVLPFFLLPISAAEDLGTRLDQEVRPYVDRGQFMGAVLVARGDEVLLDRAYGYANLEWDVPNTTDAKFRLGSLSKQFTAAAILLLEQDGKLRVEDPAKKYITDAPAVWDKITLHHVLTHTSGIPSITSFPDFGATKTLPTTLEKSYRRYRDKPLEFEPGALWKYSNSGYLLLAYVIEKVSGKKYDDFLRERIFTPLGMNDSGGDQHAPILRHRAYGYTPAGDKVLRNADYLDMSIPIGGGSLYSTTHDLLKWERGLFGGRVLSAASLKKMTTPFLHDYAYGLGVETAGGRKMISHNGGIEGFNSRLNYYPEAKVVVVVLANQNTRAADELGVKLGDVVNAGK